LNNPLVGAVKEKVFARLPQLKGNLHYSMAYGNMDWTHTQAYAVGTMGNVYLNVRGREPNGLVEPGAYEKTRDEIIATMRALCDPETQKPIFDFVYRREEIYNGDAVDIAPDVIGVIDGPYHIAAVDWRRASNSRAVVQKVGTELLFVSDTSGQHRMDGILAASGAGIRARAVFDSQPQLIDLAPTVLQLLGEAVPEDMDGRVLNELLKDDRRVAFAPATDIQATRMDGYSDDEAKEIEERLAGLGYLG
jgi:predicted AlkP superfamily phosphohydrolase/phosphomutase